MQLDLLNKAYDLVKQKLTSKESEEEIVRQILETYKGLCVIYEQD